MDIVIINFQRERREDQKVNETQSEKKPENLESRQITACQDIASPLLSSHPNFLFSFWLKMAPLQQPSCLLPSQFQTTYQEGCGYDWDDTRPSTARKERTKKTAWNEDSFSAKRGRGEEMSVNSILFFDPFSSSACHNARTEGASLEILINYWWRP